jgi:nitroreductase
MRLETSGSGSAGRGAAASPEPSDRIRILLGHAVQAPSRHNTQPWLFDVEGDVVGVHADARRALPEADPDGRQLIMACGAAAVNLRVAAAHHGYATSLEPVPGHRRDGLLARVRLEERCAATPEGEELFQAIARRHTNRLPLDGRDPPEGLLTRLLREARREGVFLRPVEPGQRRAVAELVAEGSRAQWSNPRFRAELAAWTRTGGSPARDGMPAWALGMSDVAALLRPLLLRFTNPGPEEAERDRRRALGTRALLVLSTPRDGKAEWFSAGEALQRVLLRATASGLAASFFDQPIELPDLRRRVRDVLGDPGAPQILLRLGYGREARPTPRRPVEEVLLRMAPAPGRRSAALARRSTLTVAGAPPAARPGPGPEAGAPVLH